MTQRSLTVVLTGALLAACSKPNPLFLDTWGVASDSGSISGNETATPTTDTEPPPPTTTTTPPPPTTTTVTSTTESSTSTTAVATTGTSMVDPTEMSSASSSTTGEGFFCALEMGESCCEVEIETIADNFFTNATYGVGNPGCPLVANPPVEFEEIACEGWSFGRAHALRIFHDPSGFGPQVITGSSAIALRFPMKAGELAVGDMPIPWILVQSLTLEIQADIDWLAVSALDFKLIGLPEGQNWTEGAGLGAVPCQDGNSAQRCRACGPSWQDACASKWTEMLPLEGEDGVVPGAMGPDPGTLAIELKLANLNLLADHPAGLVVLPNTATVDNTPTNYVAAGVINAHAREAMAPAKLRAVVCLQ